MDPPSAPEPRSLRLDGINTAKLAEQLAPWASDGRVYLSGTLDAAGIEEKPPTVEITGTEKVDISVQVRTGEGKSTADIEATGDNMRYLHPLLEKWMVESDKVCQ